MKRPSDEFWHSTFAKVVQAIDMYSDEMQMQAASTKNEEYVSKYFSKKEEVIEITSMKQVKGW